MKAFILILIMNLGFMLNNKIHDKQALKFSVDLADTISVKTKNIQLELRVENVTSEPIIIKNPSHWGNVYPFVEQEGRTIPLIKVKVNPEHITDMVKIEPYQVFEVKFDYTLDKILNLESLPPGRYDIFFRLQSEPPVESNVFTIIMLQYF